MRPPYWPIRWLKRILLPEFTEHLEGDLNELYEDRMEYYSSRKARQLFYWDCMQLMRPALMKPILPRSKFTIMLASHFKSGYRNLLKYKNYTALNLLGLTLGLTAAIMLYRVISFEKSYDGFNEHLHTMYYVAEESKEDGVYYQTRTPAAEKLKEQLPEVTHATRLISPNQVWMVYKDKRLKHQFSYVDRDFSEIFSFKVIEGDLATALADKKKIVISLDVSKAFFEYENAVGKVLTSVDGKTQYEVGAVIENPPVNSSFSYEILTSWENTPDWLLKAGDWHNTFMTAVIRMKPGVTPTSIQDKLNLVSQANFLPDGDGSVFHLIPLAEYHGRISENKDTIALLLTIAVVISLIAFVNFVNLSAAQSLNRLREVGIRKVMGSRQGELVMQFIIESVLICLISCLAAFCLSILLTDQVNQFFDLRLQVQTVDQLTIFIGLVIVSIIIGFFAGLYPTIYLIKKDIGTALIGDSKKGSQKMIFQKVLIVVQYVASIFLIAGTLIIWRQIAFMKNQDLNLDMNQVIVASPDFSSFGNWDKARAATKRFNKELQEQRFIKSTAFTSNPPGAYFENYNDLEDLSSGKIINLRQTNFSSDVLATLEIELTHGRNYDDQLPSDTMTVLINEAAFKAFGWTDLENKKLRPSGDKEIYDVIGVTKDYHYQALNREVQPMIHWYLGPDPLSYHLLVRYEEGKVSEALDYMKEAWKSTGSFVDLDYYFLDSNFDKLYREQERMGAIAGSFAFVAILLASLGLFALASYMIRQRRKEIGIRKVMGATVRQITVKLSSNFIQLVLLSIALSVPLIWYSSDQFLNTFSYRINPGAEIYVLAAFGAILMAVSSVTIHAFFAASDDPTKSLRDE